MFEDRLLEARQRRVGFDTQLLDERLAQPSVCAQRIGLTAAAIQGHHELAREALSQRVLTHQLGELTREGTVLTEREVRADAVLQRGEPQLGQPRDVSLREGLIGEVRQGFAPPECERGPQRTGRVGWSSRELVAALRCEALETRRVDSVGLDGEQVAGFTGDQNLAGFASDSIGLEGSA